MNCQEIREILEKTGLSRIESRIYFTLLKLGPSKAGLISKKSQVNRTSTYDVLERLVEKGLVKYVIKSNNKFFECVNPSRLIEVLEERKNEIKKVLPILTEIYQIPKEKSDVVTYKGYNGVKSVFQDILREAKSVCVMDSEGQLIDRMPNYSKYFIKELEKRNIQVKHLIRNRKNSNPSKTTKVRYIDKKTKSEAVINIYEDKLVIIVWTDPPEAVVIKNRATADSFRDYFDIIWNLAKTR
ncbi:MAG: TrmB family transcriptional regulator [Candidatus Heimdallarchaeaceae archaeon]